jgi:1-acyl-sn-glycerol-3-phosphate acyltransferase
MTRAGFAARVGVMAVLFALLAPVQAVAGRRGARLAHLIPVGFHRAFLRLFDIRVTVRGTPPAPGHPTLVLANHVSWLDIPVMGSLLPLSFIAKQEIASWPVFGLCAKLQRCIFLDRTRKAATAETNAEVAERLAGGDAIVLFPEGTTGDGIRLLPFRSSLVGAARAALAESAHEEIRLQPMSVAYTHRNGLPVTRREMPELAWYGDMELAPHLLAYARGGPLDVLVSWGEPIPFGRDTDRKRATLEAEAEVRRLLRRAPEVPASHVLARTQARQDAA